MGVNEIPRSWHLADLLGDELSESDDDAEVGLKCSERCNGFWIADFLGANQRNLFSECDFGNG